MYILTFMLNLHLRTACNLWTPGICVWNLWHSADTNRFTNTGVFFQQGIVCNQSDVSLPFSQSHGRTATAWSSAANLVTLALALATFQTLSKAKHEKSSDFFWSLQPLVGNLQQCPKTFKVTKNGGIFFHRKKHACVSQKHTNSK